VDTYEALNERRSVRKYKTDPVPEDKLKLVLEAARVAPSWKNQQCWRFIVVSEKEQREAISACMPESNPARRAVTETAPLVIVLCADPQASGDKDGKDFYMLDAGITMQQLMLAAHAEGLGTCWVGFFDEETVRTACGVPSEYRVVALTPLGIPETVSSKRPRMEIEEIVFKNKWGNPFKL